MANPRVQLNMRGVNAVLKSPGVQAEVDRVGRRMADAGGEGIEYKSAPHRFTSRGYVQTTNWASFRRQRSEHVLQRVLGGQS